MDLRLVLAAGVEEWNPGSERPITARVRILVAYRDADLLISDRLLFRQAVPAVQCCYVPLVRGPGACPRASPVPGRPGWRGPPRPGRPAAAAASAPPPATDRRR